MNRICRNAASVVTLAGCLALPSAVLAASGDEAFSQKVTQALDKCIEVSKSCADNHTDAAGILVFPNVVKFEVGIGGGGGQGALIQNGEITGYYRMGEATAGAEVGIDDASFIYLVESPDALSRIESGEWNVGAETGITVVDGANARAQSNADVLSYVVTARGLDADASVSVGKIWPEKAN